MKELLILFLVINFCYSFSQDIITTINKTYPVLDGVDTIYVLNLESDYPEEVEYLGYIAITGKKNSTLCDYQSLVEKAKDEAGKIGGNLVKIVGHMGPSSFRKCHQIAAKIYRFEEIPEILENELDIINEISSFDSSSNYALLHIYCLDKSIVSTGYYKIYLKDAVLCSLDDYSKHTFIVNQEGELEIWAEMDLKESMLINFKHGKE